MKYPYIHLANLKCTRTIINPYNFYGNRQTEKLRCEAAKRGVPSRAILFIHMKFIEPCNKNEKSLPMSLLRKWAPPFDKDGKVHSSPEG